MQSCVEVTTYTVSIPERVWGGLELDYLAGIAEKLAVSIPERVWGGLERLTQSFSSRRLMGFNP